MSRISTCLRHLVSASLLLGLGLLLTFSPVHAEPVSDFALEDVNSTSPRYGDSVSPRNYRHQVSAYYFGAAT